VWQHGGVGLSPRGVTAGGVGGGQEDTLELIFFWINEKHCLQCLLLSFVWLWDSIWTSSVLCLLTLKLHLIDCDPTPLFLVFHFLSLYSHIHILYYISWYWQNRYRPEFRLKRLSVPLSVTQSWHFTDTGPRRDVGGWGRDPRKQKEFCTTLQKQKINEIGP